MSRLVELPFVYGVYGTLRGKRNADLTWVRDTLPVEIRSVHRDDAPLALKITRHEKQIEFRAFKRRPLHKLTGPTSSDWAADDSVQLTLSNIDRELEKLGPHAAMRWPMYPIDLMRSGNFAYPPKLNFRNELTFRSIERDGLAEARADIAAKLSRLVAIDGEIYSEAPEWTWRVESGGRRHSTGGHLFAMDDPRGSKISHPAFRLDQLGKAQRYAARLCEVNRWRPDIRATVEDAGLIDWRFDSELHGAELAARTVFSRMESAELARMPEAFFEPFCRIRQIARAKCPARSDVATLLPDLMDLREAALAAPDQDRSDRIDDLIWDLDMAIWRMQTIDADFHAARTSSVDDDALASLAP